MITNEDQNTGSTALQHTLPQSQQSCPQQEYTIGTTCPNTPCCRKQFWSCLETRSQKGPNQVFQRNEKSAVPLLEVWIWEDDLWLHMLDTRTLVAQSEDPPSGTTETKSPQEFLLARVSTVVMDILIDFLLVRRQRFLNNCFTVTTIFIVKRRFVCHHHISSIAVGIKFMLLCLCRKGKSRVPNFQIRPRLCHSTFLWRLSCKISQQVERRAPSSTPRCKHCTPVTSPGLTFNTVSSQSLSSYFSRHV